MSAEIIPFPVRSPKPLQRVEKAQRRSAVAYDRNDQQVLTSTQKTIDQLFNDFLVKRGIVRDIQ